MIRNDLTAATLETAIEALGDGPVAMVNLLWFRDHVDYPDGFQNAMASPREAYYEGFAGAIRVVAADLGISMTLIHTGSRPYGLLASPAEDWDDIVIVRYDTLGDLKRIVESEAYRRTAEPHRLAAIANWRFFATGSS